MVYEQNIWVENREYELQERRIGMEKSGESILTPEAWQVPIL
jgi:hypothetical protein